MKRFAWLIYFLAIVIAAIVLWRFPKWTVDDAFISYRYGVNLAETGQLVWNPGEKPVEGYTGIMLPLLAAGAHYLGLDIVLSIKVVMLICWLGVLAMVYYLGKKLKINELIISTSISLWVINPIIYTHLVSGLETLLFALLLILMISFNYLIINNKNSDFRTIFLASLTGLLLLLTRPEGMALVPVIVGGGWVTKRMIWKNWDFKYIIISLIFYVLPFLAYSIWRHSYYGNWLPNTWHAKRFEGAFNPDALMEMGHTLMVTIGPMLVWVVIGRIAFKPTKSGHPEEQARSWLIIISCLVPLLLALGYGRSHLFMNYSHRFFAPTIAVMLVPIMLEGDRILRQLQVEGTNALKKKLLILGFGLLSIVQIVFFMVKLKTEITWSEYYQRIVDQEFVPVADTLRKELPPTATVAIYMDAGMIPYRSGLKCIDFGKLNDEVLAHGPRDAEFVADYFFTRNPDAAVFTSFSWENYDYIEEAEFIMADPRFENYRLLRKFKTDQNDPYYQFLFIRTASNSTNPE